MGKAEQRAKDAAAAANLRTSPGHNARAVAARKEGRLRQHLAQLSGDNKGSAAFRRRNAR